MKIKENYYGEQIKLIIHIRQNKILLN